MLNKQAGFSLIEIMVVMVIIALLAGIVGPQVFGVLDDAKRDKAKADFSSLATTLKLYKLDNFLYPSTEQGLEALVTKTGTSPEPRNFKKGGYIERLPKDPWGAEYIYLSPGDHGVFDIYSYGADGVAGGEDEAADVGNWSDK